jgi:hypothetical protein
MENRFWIGTRIAVALRWLIQRLGVRRIGFLVLSEYEGVASPIRPTSGDAVSIDWSLWIGFGDHWRGYGAVRTWARFDDLEIWIAGVGPFTSIEGRIDLYPAIKRPAIDFKYVKVRNSAPNPRRASGHVQLAASAPAHGAVAMFDYCFRSPPTGESEQVPGIWFELYESGYEVEVSTLFFKTVPVGAARVERLYGVPEWKAENDRRAK